MQRHPIEQADMEAIADRYGIDWSPLAGSTVLITGAAGFLPAYMVETLMYLNESHGLNVRVLALARNRAGFERRFAHLAGRSDLVCIEQDISRPFTLDERVDYIVHAASQASPKYYSTDPVGTLSANTLGTAALLELARTSAVKGFLYFSSSEVYGQPPRVPTAEGDYGVVDPTNVRACYAESKRMGENMCVSWHHQHGVPVKIVRPFHTYGPRMQLDDGRVYADGRVIYEGGATQLLTYRDFLVITENGRLRVYDRASGESWRIPVPDDVFTMRAHAVDDYGADDSDINRIKELKPDIVKFDAHWIAHLMDSGAGFALLTTMVEAFETQGIRTVFEGIEENWQLDLAEKAGASMVQGYVLAKPELAPTTFRTFAAAEAPPDRQLRALLHAWLEHIATHRDHMLVFAQERHVIEREPQWRRVRGQQSPVGRLRRQRTLPRRRRGLCGVVLRLLAPDPRGGARGAPRRRRGEAAGRHLPHLPRRARREGRAARRDDHPRHRRGRTPPRRRRPPCARRGRS